MYSTEEIITGYSKWVNEKITDGFDPHFVTFMFKHLASNQNARWSEMVRVIDMVYGRVLGRTFRVPNALKHHPFRPILIVCPDFPVHKRHKDHLRDIISNDGLHAHGIWLMPQTSRLEGDLSGHFLNHGEKYARSYPILQRVHSVRIEETPENVVDYAFKTLKARRVSSDDIAIWPRPRTEGHTN